jgi:hypothetical protein
VETARRTLDELVVKYLGGDSPQQSFLSPMEGNAFIDSPAPGAKMVVEAKASGVYTLKATLEVVASLSEMDVTIEANHKKIAGCEEIKNSARIVVGGGAKTLSLARLVDEQAARRLVGLDCQLGRLPAATDDSQA